MRPVRSRGAVGVAAVGRTAAAGKGRDLARCGGQVGLGWSLVPAVTETGREKLVVPSAGDVTSSPFLVIVWALQTAFLGAQKVFVVWGAERPGEHCEGVSLVPGLPWGLAGPGPRGHP